MTGPQAATPQCRFCAAPLTRTFADLGTMPLANSYLAALADAAQERAYPLHARVCGACRLVQVDDAVPPDAIFSDYAYFSSNSRTWVAHARAYTEMARQRFALTPHSQVVEIASNDGYLLQHFVAADIPALGVEPAANVAAAAEAAGVPTRVAFFGRVLATQLRDELRSMGHEAFVSSHRIGERIMTRVAVGPYLSLVGAETLRINLSEELSLEARVVAFSN